MVRGYDTGVDPYRTLAADDVAEDVWTDAHYFNHQLRRRLGLSSGTVGRLAILDATKAGIVRLSRRTQRLLRPERSPAES